MADGPALALQAALVAHLKADAGVAALIGARVYDEPPQAVAFPYLRIGRISVDPVRNACETEWTATFSIEAHSRPVAGRVEAARVSEAVVAALDDAALTITGFNCRWCWLVTTDADRDNDGKSYAARSVYEAHLGV